MIFESQIPVRWKPNMCMVVETNFSVQLLPKLNNFPGWVGGWSELELRLSSDQWELEQGLCLSFAISTIKNYHISCSDLKPFIIGYLRAERKIYLVFPQNIPKILIGVQDINIFFCCFYTLYNYVHERQIWSSKWLVWIGYSYDRLV